MRTNAFESPYTNTTGWDSFDESIERLRRAERASLPLPEPLPSKPASHEDMVTRTLAAIKQHEANTAYYERVVYLTTQQNIRDAAVTAAKPHVVEAVGMAQDAIDQDPLLEADLWPPQTKDRKLCFVPLGKKCPWCLEAVLHKRSCYFWRHFVAFAPCRPCSWWRQGLRWILVQVFT